MADLFYTLQLERERDAEAGQLVKSDSAASMSLLWLKKQLCAVGHALSGDLLLEIIGDTNETIAAGFLNAAPVGAATRQFQVALRATGKETHTWASFAPVIVPSEMVADPDVGAPLVAPATFSQGLLTVYMTLATDEGQALVYQAGDSVSVKVQVAADDELLGWPVSPVTKTYTVI